MGPAEKEGLSRITTVVPGTDESICKLVQQFHKLVDLHEVRDAPLSLFFLKKEKVTAQFQLLERPYMHHAMDLKMFLIL